MNKRCFKHSLLSALILTSPLCHASLLYIGPGAVWFHDTWDGMLSPDPNKPSPLNLSLLKNEHEKSLTWSIQAGVNVNSYFSVQAQYIQCPKTQLILNGISRYNQTPLREDWSLSSQLHSYSLDGKFKIPISRTKATAYSLTGLSYTQRKDDIAHISTLGAHFGIGIEKNIYKKIRTNLACEFFTGTGKATETPLKNYIPFIYLMNLTVSYDV